MAERTRYKLVDVDNSIEEHILAGAIISTPYLLKVEAIMDLEYIKSKPIRTVLGWVLDYFDSHASAPGTTIQDIFEIECRNSKVDDEDIIEAILVKVSERYGSSSEFNVEYINKKTVEYFRKRSLQVTCADALHYAEKGNLAKAEETFRGRKEVTEKLSLGKDPISLTAIDSWWDKATDELMRLPGYFGDYMAPLQRGRLIGVLGPPKRGKSAWLLEFFLCAIQHRLKAAFYSLEMNDYEVEYRLSQRICSFEQLPEGMKQKTYTYCVYDCLHNQMGECEKVERTNRIALVDEDGNYPEPEQVVAMNYTECTACRDVPGHDQDYKQVLLRTQDTRRVMTKEDVKRIHTSFIQHYGEDNGYIECRPVNTFGIQELEQSLDELEFDKGFIPDVLVIDYADIMKKPRFDERRHQIGDIWENLSRIAKERNMLTFTGSQGNRGSIMKEDLDMADLAEDISKANIVDVLLGINQTMEEKANEISRISILNHRYRGFNPFIQCQTLQCRELGQTLLDSGRYEKKRKQKKGSKK
jgi:hypothetical protein